ncbi:SDR family NAD(P)-dependent oxidoreductase [Bacillus sp. CGMCC 1.16541]|uniref:SDR family NAD(P)-dependent oxidoreductase n=1 Tax=Bacillus sp. CGMCC 1.16541 TaxID=2185143 RepID=UPI000D73AC10|nr:SDR family NAD(P)-dependent oxidoreductase [Bacillus sp. CGMCC 1.16541]
MNNRVVIITGSTRGIGKSIAELLAFEGSSIVINGRSEEAVQDTVKEIQSRGGKAVGVSGAVEELATGKQLVSEAVHHFGKVDVLINNAGVVHDRMTHKMSEREWDEVMNSHLKGTFASTQPFIKQVKQQKSGGYLVNMTSTAGLEGTVGQVNYSAAKAGILGMTWTLAKELVRDHIIVNAIAPAALTDMTRPFVEVAKQKAKEKETELEDYWDIGSAEDVAVFVRDLLCLQDSTLTGQVFSVNGKTIGRWQAPRYESFNLADYSL